MGESVVEVHTSEGNLFLVNLKGPGGCITIQLTLTLKMTTAKVVETSVTVNNNSPIQDYVHPDDQTQPTFEKHLYLQVVGPRVCCHWRALTCTMACTNNFLCEY